MKILQIVCGNTDGPAPNQPVFVSEILRDAVVHKMEVNKLNLTCLDPDPDFISNPVMGKVTLQNNNNFTAGHQILVYYTPTK